MCQSEPIPTLFKFDVCNNLVTCHLAALNVHTVQTPQVICKYADRFKPQARLVSDCMQTKANNPSVPEIKKKKEEDEGN